MALPNNTFTGYSPDRMQQLAQSYGYNDANLAEFGKFLEANPARAKQYFDQQNLDMFGEKRMRQFQVGGYTGPTGFTPPATTDPTQPIFDPDPVSYYNPDTQQVWTAPTGGWSAPSDWVEGSIPRPWEAYYQPWQPAAPPEPEIPKIGIGTAERIQQPRLPPGAAFQAPMVPYTQEQLMRQAAGQLVAPGGAQVTGAAQVEAAQQALPTQPPTERTMETVATTGAIQNLALQAAQQQTPSQLVEAAQANQTTVSNLEAAQLGQATQIDSPAKRALETGELVSSAVGQAAQAAEFIEPIAQAATATPTPSATVQGQLATLMQQFEQSEDTPVWARGAVRLAQQEMAKRGLGASSMAGQAIVEAAMEKAIAIAQIDAQVVATFEKENLSNRQQMATLRAQQRATFMGQEFDQAFKTRVQNAARISDIADRNFTAEQQVALENAKLAQTVDLENLSNNQALVIANATALASLDTTSLNNRQKAAVENAKNFLQLDMQTLDNNQQGARIQYEKIAESLLTDAAQQNAANKINITEANQMDQFYAELTASISRSNNEQTNAINKFNAGEINAISRFNSESITGREMFNAKNQLAIEQSNAVWRREIATADTAAINFQNQFNAKNILDVSQQAYDNLWQEYRDVMDMAWQSGESELDRIQALQILAANSQNAQLVAQYQADRENSAGIGGWLGDIFAPFAKAGVGKLLGMTDL